MGRAVINAILSDWFVFAPPPPTYYQEVLFAQKFSVFRGKELPLHHGVAFVASETLGMIHLFRT